MKLSLFYLFILLWLSTLGANKLKKMEPLPLSISHPESYIVDERLASCRPRGAKGAFWGGCRGGPPGVHFSSASHGLNAVSNQFVLPLEAAQKGPFSGPPVLEVRTATLNFFFLKRISRFFVWTLLNDIILTKHIYK